MISCRTLAGERLHLLTLALNTSLVSPLRLTRRSADVDRTANGPMKRTLAAAPTSVEKALDRVHVCVARLCPLRSAGVPPIFARHRRNSLWAARGASSDAVRTRKRGASATSIRSERPGQGSAIPRRVWPCQAGGGLAQRRSLGSLRASYRAACATSAPVTRARALGVREFAIRSANWFCEIL